MNNDVMTLMTNGGEIIGRVISETDHEYCVESPRLFAQTAEGVGFVPGICMTGISDPAEVNIRKSAVIFVTPANENIRKAWIQQTTGLVL